MPVSETGTRTEPVEVVFGKAFWKSQKMPVSWDLMQHFAARERLRWLKTLGEKGVL